MFSMSDFVVCNAKCILKKAKWKINDTTKGYKNRQVKTALYHNIKN